MDQIGTYLQLKHQGVLSRFEYLNWDLLDQLSAEVERILWFNITMTVFNMHCQTVHYSSINQLRVGYL